MSLFYIPNPIYCGMNVRMDLECIMTTFAAKLLRYESFILSYDTEL